MAAFPPIPPAPRFRVPGPLADRVRARDDFACVYCGRSGGVLVPDHARPCAHFPATATRAEVNDPANLITACDDCNRAKGPQDLEGFARMLRGRGVSAADVAAMVQRARAAVACPLPPDEP